MVHILASVAFLLSAGQASAQPLQVSGKVATERDGKVLEALMLSLVEDSEFPAPSNEQRTEIILHRRTPKAVDAIVNASQVNYETGGRIMPKDAWDDLERRNVVRLDPNARLISYEALVLSEPIRIGNVFPSREGTFVGKTFEEVFPNARGWLETYVPGFSKDGKTAVVRGRVGPSEKPAMLTAIVRFQGGKWAVAWRRICVYK